VFNEADDKTCSPKEKGSRKRFVAFGLAALIGVVCDSFLSKQIRVEYWGAIYHVMAHGDHREKMAIDDEDRRRFEMAWKC